MTLDCTLGSVSWIIRLDSPDVYALKNCVSDLDRNGSIYVNVLNAKLTRVTRTKLRTRHIFEKNIHVRFAIKS